MGEVYRAEDGNLDRQVAIKVLPDSLAADPERLARFEPEAKLPASLNHPNIASIYGLERADDRRTDIWAFGCVLYECLTGKRAFHGEAVTEIVASILKSEPDWTLLPAASPAAEREALVSARRPAYDRKGESWFPPHGRDATYSGSLISVPDAQNPGGAPHDPEQGCTFWTRPDGHVCLQRFSPKEDVDYQPHAHSEYNIVICLAGAVTKTQMGETHVIEAGQTMMGNFGVEHASGYLTSGDGCEAVCLTVDRRVLTGLLKSFRLPLPKGSKSPVFLGKLNNQVIFHCAKDVAQEMQNQKLGHQIILEGLASRILIETLRSWPRKAVESCEVDLTPRLPRRDFVRAYEFMRWCRKDAFRLEHLCRFLGSSEGRFTRLFRAATHASPASFYNRLLLERGRDLLADRSLSIKEISFHLGYKTSSHFVVAFHREFGIPPHAYRQGCDHESAGATTLE